MVQHGVSVLWYGIVLDGMVLHGTLWVGQHSGLVWYGTAWYGIGGSPQCYSMVECARWQHQKQLSIRSRISVEGQN